MKNQHIIWLASYPRSGNTLLRTVLWHCLGLRSASIYPLDLGGNTALENYVGHIEHSRDGRIAFPEGALPLIKTHGHPSKPQGKTIYIVRDGRAACVSLWEFYNRSIAMDSVIQGHHRFGTWARHLSTWKPWERKNTLLLRYEDIVDNLPSVLDSLSRFLNRKIIAPGIPEREHIADVDGRWVRKKTRWQSVLSDEQLKLFNTVNRKMMRKMMYCD